MLNITIPVSEAFDENSDKIIERPKTVIHMEHSLVSLYKWEAKFHKPFLETEKTPLELLEYFRCMTIDKNVDPIVYYNLTQDDCIKINSYINDPMTATTITTIPSKGGQKNDVWTAEMIYYYMIVNGIPFECQKWHLNQLIMLIRLCTVKNNPQEKMNQEEVMKQYKELNEARRKKLNTTG